MTPDDVASIRATCAECCESVLALCDALEQAWDERDDQIRQAEIQAHRALDAEAELEAFRDSGLFEMWTQDRARAERAEAALDRVRDLCELVETYDHPVAWHTEIRAAIEGDPQ